MSKFALLCMVYLPVAVVSTPVCTTPECTKLGKYYLANMDQTVKPCTNFYKYVCHNWPRHNPKPIDFLSWGIESMVDRRIDEELKEILESSRISNIPEFEKEKFIYKICMNSAYLGRKDSNSIKRIMSQVPAWPLLHSADKKLSAEQVWIIDNEYSKITGESALFYISVNVAPKTDYYLAYLGVMPSPYGMLVRISAWKKKTEWPNYKSFLKRLIKAVAPNPSALSDTTLDIELDRVIEFRVKYEKVITDSYLSYDGKQMTIRDFQEWYNKQLMKGNVQVHWLEVIRSFYNNPNDIRQEKFPKKVAFFGDEMRNLIKLLETTPKRVVVNHIHLYFLEKHLNLGTQMMIHLKESITNGVNTTGKILYDIERWMKCIAFHNMPNTLTKMYIDKYFDAETESKVDKLILETKSQLATQIFESNWVDIFTKLRSVEKLYNISSTIGLPEWYRFPLAEPRNMDKFALKAEAHYIPASNHIYISAAYLKWPLYIPNMPFVIDHGATGSLIGHELYHAFDLTAVLSNLSKNSWSPAMMELYVKQSKCFMEHYIKYKETEHKKHNLNMISYTKEARDEDIADAMGLKVAYLAYREALKKNNDVCPVIPGFEKFGCEKLFFIAFANTHCSISTTGETENSLITDNHNLHNVRVNGGVANMKEFSDAFGCTTNDPLSFKKICDIWKQ